MSDLLPCPFCGGEKLLTTTNEHGGFCLTCENCDAIGPPSEYDPAQMREEWNTRADHVEALLKAEREKALREAQERIRKKGNLFSVSVIEAMINRTAKGADL